MSETPLRAMVLLVMVLGCSLVPSVEADASPQGAGDQLWAARYNGTQAGCPLFCWDDAYSVAASPDGSRVFVTGDSVGTGTLADFATLAYDAVTGATLWTQRYDGGQDDYGTALVASPDGRSVFVTGLSDGPTGNPDFATVAYDSVSGSRRWVARFGGPSDAWDVPEALGVSVDGSRVFVTGYSSSPHGDDFATVAYDATTGAQLWVKRYDGPRHGQDDAQALAVDPDGSRIFVTGNSEGGGGDYLTLAYDAVTGSTLWRARIGARNPVDLPASLVASPDGSTVFVTGQPASRHRNSDYGTVAYDAATGAELWRRRWSGSGFDDAVGVVAAPDGSRIFVAGLSYVPGGGSDFGTVAADPATGAILWRQRDEMGVGKALVVSPDSSMVFVTGA